MRAKVNPAAVLKAMRLKGWNVQATCAQCGIGHTTLTTILAGELPKRLDAWFRLVNGLELDEKEAIILPGNDADVSRHQAKAGPGKRTRWSPV